MPDVQLPLDDAKAVRFQTDDAFRQMVLEHHALDERIRQLSDISHLSNVQHFEELALKKRKLALKDRIEAAMRGQGLADSSA